MRLSAVLPLIAGVIFGGVALAQPGLVLDPWARPAPAEENSWFSPEPVRAQSEPSRAASPRDPSAPELLVGPSLLHTSRAAESPAADARRAAAEPSRINARLVDPWIADPWAASPSGATKVASEAPQAHVASDRWPSRVVEVVDPWRRSPRFSHTMPFELLVDPWRR